MEKGNRGLQNAGSEKARLDAVALYGLHGEDLEDTLANMRELAQESAGQVETKPMQAMPPGVSAVAATAEMRPAVEA